MFSQWLHAMVWSQSLSVLHDLPQSSGFGCSLEHRRLSTLHVLHCSFLQSPSTVHADPQIVGVGAGAGVGGPGPGRSKRYTCV